MRNRIKIMTTIGAIAALLFIFSLALPVASAISAGVNPPKFTIKAEYLQVNRSIWILNSGDKQVTVNFTGEVEGVELEFEANDFTLSPGEEDEVRITFKIANRGYYRGEIVVKFSEVAGKGQIASSITFPCPVAIDAKDAITAPPTITSTPAPTPTPSPTSSPNPTPTPTSSYSSTSTSTPTPTPTPSPTPTPPQSSTSRADSTTPLPANETNANVTTNTNSSTSASASGLKIGVKGTFNPLVGVLIGMGAGIATLFLSAKLQRKK